jgi:hypothetical protein
MLKAGNRVPLKSILRAMIITSQVPTARKWFNSGKIVLLFISIL